MTIHNFRFTTDTLRGTHEELIEMVRQVAAFHFNECVQHFDSFKEIAIDYDVTENGDGTLNTTTTAIVTYDDEWWLDDEDDGLSGALVPNDPYPFAPSVGAANADPVTNPFSFPSIGIRWSLAQSEPALYGV